MSPIQKPKKKNEFRLRSYYYLIELTAFLVLGAVGASVYIFKDYLTWLRYPTITVIGFGAMITINFTAFLLQLIFKSDSFFQITRYTFMAFFLLIIYTTGGALSHFTILLIFPLLVSILYLDEKKTKESGIICSVGLASMIFLDKEYLTDIAIIIEHLFKVVLYVVIATYAHKIVKGTLQQKFEKEEAKRKTGELIELDKVKSDFVTVTSHQLRTPIAGIKWALDTLVKGGINDPEMEKNLLADSREKIDDALTIVNDMLATVEAGNRGLLLAKDTILLGDMMRSVTDELKYLAEQKKVAVTFHAVGDTKILGDERMLQASLINIVDNAIRYSPHKTVDITVLRRENAVVVVVSDTGLGIPYNDQPYVFDRFYRGGNVMKLEPNETGVGMYVTKEVIERHGGTIGFESKPNEGTTFTVALPAAPSK